MQESRGHLKCQETKAKHRAGKSKMTRYRQSQGKGLEKKQLKSPTCVLLSAERYLEARRHTRIRHTGADEMARG